MKRAILLSVALLTAGVAQAEDERVETCMLIHELAESVMESYQSGVPITKVLGISKNGIMRDMVLEAYDSTRYTSHDSQQRAIESFADKWGMACYIHLKSAK